MSSVEALVSPCGVEDHCPPSTFDVSMFRRRAYLTKNAAGK